MFVVWRIALVLGCAMTLASGAAQQAPAFYTPPIAPLYWSGLIPVDPGGPILGMSCPSTSLCVASDDHGDVVTSTEPAGGTGAWTVADIDGKDAIKGVSCVSVSLCVAIDADGNALVSTNPTGGAAAWTLTPVDPVTGLREITGISCVQGPLCALSDSTGNVVTSTNPMGGTGAWAITDIDGASALEGISCSSTSLCVAVDGAGNVLSSTSPTSGAGAWIRTNVNGSGPILGVSCTAAPLCVAGAATERRETPRTVLASTNPSGGAGAWTATSPPLEASPGASFGSGISCVQESLCAAVERGTNGGTVWQSTEPAAGAATWAGSGPGFGVFLESISCATRSLCVVGDSQGNIASSIEAHPLSVSLQGAGIGRVKSTPSKCPFTTCTRSVPPGAMLAPAISEIACSNLIGPPSGAGTCELGYPAGTEVTLTAEPEAGSIFTGWGGPCQGSTLTCTLTMDADEPVLASFTPASPPNPAISGLTETVSTWREGRALAQIADRKTNHNKLPVGTTFSFSLNEAASAKFTFTEPTGGRKVGKTCVARTNKNKRERRCTRTIVAGTLTFAAPSGTNEVRFDGLISKHRKLKPGTYTLAVTATASGQQATNRTLHFTIANS
jgi:hypothetical protein